MDCRIIAGMDRRRLLALALALVRGERTIAGLIEARAALSLMLIPLLHRPVAELKQHIDLAEAYRPVPSCMRSAPGLRPGPRWLNWPIGWTCPHPPCPDILAGMLAGR